MTPTATRKNGFVDSFSTVERELAEQGPAWLRQRRRDAMARFEQAGFPTPGVEAWKNTNVAPIVNAPFVPAAEGGKPSSLLSAATGTRLVFVDGRLSTDLSDPGTKAKGIWIGSMAAALEQIPGRLEPWLDASRGDDAPAFRSLNTALARDGAVILIDDEVEFDQPLELTYLSSDGGDRVATHPRTLIVAGRGAHVAIVETFLGASGAYLTNAVTEIFAGDNSIVDHVRLQLESEQAYHVSATELKLGRDSRVRTFNLDLGGALVRNEARGVLDGEGAECTMNGLYILRGSQHVDNHTILDHAKPHGDSRELYKGILRDSARSVFNGRVIVRPDAQKTDAKQSNPNLILSDKAVAHTRPQLEIYADDVKCTHGATIGRLDEDAIFYLRSRGISAEDARGLMIEAFAGEVLERIEDDAIRQRVRTLVDARLIAARS